MQVDNPRAMVYNQIAFQKQSWKEVTMATKDAVLQALQNSEGAFLSGEELSNKLSVSRTTVWKAIKALREEGHPIEAVTNRGYMLMSDSWTITEDILCSVRH